MAAERGELSLEGVSWKLERQSLKERELKEAGQQALDGNDGAMVCSSVVGPPLPSSRAGMWT